MRLKEMMELAEAGDSTELNAFVRRIIGGEVREGELDTGYDQWLFRNVVATTLEAEILDELKKGMAVAAIEETPILRNVGIKAKLARERHEHS